MSATFSWCKDKTRVNTCDKQVFCVKYGRKYWYLNGKCHRENWPAIEYPDGTKIWYLNGKLHRENGPACDPPNGCKVWYVNGKIHRADGPAVERVDGDKHWYLEGIYYDYWKELRK